MQPVVNVQPQPQPQASSFTSSIFKMVLFYFVTNSIFSYFKAPNKSYSYTNYITHSEPFVLKVVINSTQNDPFVWVEEDLFYDTADSNFRTLNFTTTPQQLLDNPDVTAFVSISLVNRQLTRVNHFKLCDMMKMKKEVVKNLMFDAQDEYMIKKEDALVDVSNTSKLLHYKSMAFINLIYDTSAYPVNAIPQQFIGKYVFENSTEEGLKYFTYIDVDNYKLRRKHHFLVEDVGVPLNQSINITLEFQTQTYWKVQKLYIRNQFLMTQSLKDSGKMYEQFGMENIMDEVAQDEFKEMIFETNIYLLSLTLVVSLLHTVFSTLAIKNDIEYWKNLDSQQGISVRMLYQNFVLEIVITLYLFDNNTSKMILFQSVIELFLMVWKIMKTTKLKKRVDLKFPYYELDHANTYKKTTEEHDKQAMKYLYRLLLPLFLCYLVYSLVYEEHKGWYSFFLSSCVGFIYVFGMINRNIKFFLGFINMTPQLYINYKLKSVAHLPWKNMIYRFLNTIVDDLFAFIITMPWLKRLSCFRDDIIFLIYIYQRRIYRVDMNRRDVNGVDRPKAKEGEESKEEPQEQPKAIEQPIIQKKQKVENKHKKE